MRLSVALAMVAVGLTGCVDGGVGPNRNAVRTDIGCSIPEDQLLSGGVGRDGIPALTDPTMVDASDPTVGYLAEDDRVIGIKTGNVTYAIPLNILWWHEIVNLNLRDVQLAVTHCPLTGSSLVFDRGAVDGAEFGVSGLLYLNNLVMYDRNENQSLWPQMLRGARCGTKDGTKLPMYPAVEMEWNEWQRLHPDTRVVSSETGYDRNYAVYPYGSYRLKNSTKTLFPMPFMDDRRPPKERVLGIPEGVSGVAYPFDLLASGGELRAIHDEVAGQPVVVFWSSAAQTAAAYRPAVGDTALTFAAGDSAITDVETGSVWTVDGYAVEGPLRGERLSAVDGAYIAYWFAWAVFAEGTAIRGGTG